MAQARVPGAALVLLRDGQAWQARDFGRTGFGAEDAPVGPQTVFEAASMSKPLLSMLAMQLVQAGQLDLDRPVLAYRSERFQPPQPAQARITARMLLSHRSGLPNWRPGDPELGPLELQFEPGQRFLYSGEGYYYLQRVVESIAGQPLQALARERLFGPLGMAHSSFVMTPTLAPLLSRGHDEGGQVLPPSRYDQANAAYTLYTTPADYARWLAALSVMDPRLLAPASWAQILSPQGLADDRQPLPRAGAASGRTAVQWSLGWVLDDTAQGPIAFHTGTNSTGFRGYSQFSPSRRTGLLVMSNGLGGRALWQAAVGAVGDV